MSKIICLYEGCVYNEGICTCTRITINTYLNCNTVKLKECITPKYGEVWQLNNRQLYLVGESGNYLINTDDVYKSVEHVIHGIDGWLKVYPPVKMEVK